MLRRLTGRSDGSNKDDRRREPSSSRPRAESVVSSSSVRRPTRRSSESQAGQSSFVLQELVPAARVAVAGVVRHRARHGAAVGARRVRRRAAVLRAARDL